MKLRAPPFTPWPNESLGYSLVAHVSGATIVGVHGGRYVVASMATGGYGAQGFNQSHSGDWTLESHTGIFSEATLPSGTVAATATSSTLASFAGRAPRGVVASTGTISIGNNAALAHKGRYSISSRTGMVSRANLPTGTLYAVATQGSVGRMSAIGRIGTVASRARVENYARAELIGPAVRALNGGRFAGRSPKGRVAAVASQVVVLAYEGYSITLVPSLEGMETRTTHLTQCPFDHIVRLGALYFGVGPDGVYELSGDTYDGDLIASSIETAPDGDVHNVKRPRALFVGGRLSDDFTAGVKVGETNTYSFGATVAVGTRNHRVLFGRGVRSRYLAYTFDNPSGGDFQIDDITPEHDVVRRVVGGVE